jgi:hypothetical protein
MKVEKDTVVKDVEKALVPEYVTAGWEVVEESNKAVKKLIKDDEK